MAAGDMAELVGDHALDLGGAVGGVDQPGMDIDRLAAGDEGVDRRIVDQHDIDIARIEPGGGDQRRRHVVQQGLGLGIAQHRLRSDRLGGESADGGQQGKMTRERAAAKHGPG